MNWLRKRKLRRQMEGCNYPMARDLFIQDFEGGVVPKELAALLDRFIEKPCFETASTLIDAYPVLAIYFRLARHGGFTEMMYREFGSSIFQKKQGENERSR